MRNLRFAGALLLAVLVHSAGSQLWGDFPAAVDLFLVVVVFYALGGSPLSGMLGGLVGGLVADAFTGDLYGLHGFADTIIGYGTAYAAHRIMIQRAASVFVLFALAAALQQGILIGLALAILPDAGLPSFFWLLITVGTSGVLGVVSWGLGRRIVRRFKLWRSSRSSRLR